MLHTNETIDNYLCKMINVNLAKYFIQSERTYIIQLVLSIYKTFGSERIKINPNTRQNYVRYYKFKFKIK